ncbi:MAG: DUF4982 domain-containing protein [Bacteroidota bacterium]|nr:DUF4982 domain-containing protein [Bacteroidota bacterium]
MQRIYTTALALLIVICTSFTSSAQARQKILFNDKWQFYKGDTANAEQESFHDNNWRQLNLPHDWSIEGPFSEQWASATAYLPAGIGWYRKTFTLPVQMHSKHIYIYFDGMYKNSEVLINGHYLGKRPNGFIPFEYELTQYLHAGNNVIAVKVDHSEFADSRWYTGSGIYRNVYLMATNDISIDLWGVTFSTPQVSKEKASANIAVAFTNHAASNAEVLVKTILTDNKGKQVAQGEQTVEANAGAGSRANIVLSIINPLLSSIDNPTLYTLKVVLYNNGKITDDITQRVGFRDAMFEVNKGFFLNGKNMKIKGVCIHDDAGVLGVAVPREVWERRLKILKEAGCNSVRLSHNPHADFLYDLCDSMGFLVMDEAFDEWEMGKNKWIQGWNVGTPGQQGYHEYFKEWADRDLKDMVLCNRNHPSIIFWSIGNEIDYPNDPYTNEVLNTGNNPQIYGRGFMQGHPQASELTRIATHLAAIVKQNDTTRPVTAALAGVVMSNEVDYPEVLDVVGYNYQEFRYAGDHKKYPNRIIYGSENGMNVSAWEAVENNDYISAQYLWTGIDYLGEANQYPFIGNEASLIDMAGFKKPTFYVRQSLWSDKPMIYIGTAAIPNTKNTNRTRVNATPLWNYKVGDSIMVSCFTNCDEAELFVNGKSLGKQSMASARNRTLTWNTVYTLGELWVKGFKNGKELTHDTIKTAGEPYAIKAIIDRASFDKAKKQTANIEIYMVDKNGNPVYTATNEMNVIVQGPATLLGLENGSTRSYTITPGKKNAIHGRLLAYIQSEQKRGEVKVSITSPGLKAANLIIQ